MSASTPVAPAPYTVTLDGNDYVVRIDRALVERAELTRLLDELVAPALARRQVEQAEIAALEAEVGRSSTC